MRHWIAAVLLAVLVAAGASSMAAAQSDDGPAIPAELPATVESDDGSSSNLVALLIGAVLLGSGVWAYMNKKQRFPGTRFRE